MKPKMVEAAIYMICVVAIILYFVVATWAMTWWPHIPFVGGDPL